MVMHLSNEALLVQLGYNPCETTLKELNNIIEATKGFDKISKHIADLNEHLKHYSSFVSMSSSFDYFKIKNMQTTQDGIDEVNELILNWAKKYKVEIKKVENKETFYILGFKKD
jgi:hypothetical protein